MNEILYNWIKPKSNLVKTLYMHEHTIAGIFFWFKNNDFHIDSTSLVGISPTLCVTDDVPGNIIEILCKNWDVLFIAAAAVDSHHFNMADAVS